MKTTWLIGCVCKSGDTFSLAVLIDRGLDLQIRRCNRMFFGDRRCDARLHSRQTSYTFHFLVTLFSSEGSTGGNPENISIVGADDGEGTPVPIPNTAVKLTRADNTWLEAAW